MRSPGSLIVVLALAGFAPAPSQASPFTTHNCELGCESECDLGCFDPLIAELQVRRDGGTLSRKEQKAVTKALAIIDAPSASLITDLKSVAKVANRLGRAFPAEFDTSSGWGAFLEGGLGSLTENVVHGLGRDVSYYHVRPLDEAFDALWSRAPGCKHYVFDLLRKAQTLVVKIHEFRDLATQARLFVRAVRVSALGMDAAERCADKAGVNLPGG